MRDIEPISLYIVRYTGPFGFIKPWTAVRDLTTFSQTFLTPSIIEGLRQKLEVSAILRHRLKHTHLDIQMERTQSAGWEVNKTLMSRKQSIIERGVLIDPELTLAFPTREDAEIANVQHVCLCRNEDVLLPLPGIDVIDEDEFNLLSGIELRFEESTEAFLVGYNRFAGSAPMYGHLVIVNDEDQSNGAFS